MTDAAVRLAQYSPADRDEITGGVPDPAGVAVTGLVWRDKETHFGVRRAGRLVAHAGLVETTVSVGGGEPAPVAGLGGVVVAPGLRGGGLARLVVTAAMDHARTGGAEFGLLFCWPRLIPLYERLGWRLLDAGVRVEQPQGPADMPMRSMWTPLADGARWPSGPVRLLSLPM
ncbi:GNAT family N-acetyltransferase [Streptomyces sp. NPDC002588]|uniref:GNAT family N-acetyltransferase n=1 Tax=Streptomyces sp. NPDC002588 TaxID=3154419 RepID=UPI00332B65C8